MYGISMCFNKIIVLKESSVAAWRFKKKLDKGLVNVDKTIISKNL
jgi:hypothetical protein